MSDWNERRNERWNERRNERRNERWNARRNERRNARRCSFRRSHRPGRGHPAKAGPRRKAFPRKALEKEKNKTKATTNQSLQRLGFPRACFPVTSRSPWSLDAGDVLIPARPRLSHPLRPADGVPAVRRPKRGRRRPARGRSAPRTSSPRGGGPRRRRGAAGPKPRRRTARHRRERRRQRRRAKQLVPAEELDQVSLGSCGPTSQSR